MLNYSAAVLGGGNTAFAVAANLALQGAVITLCELPEFESMIAPIRRSRTIRLDGVAAQGTAELRDVTTDLAATLEHHDLLLLIVPSYGHREWIAALGEFLAPGHTLVMMPGNLGTLEAVRTLHEEGLDPETMGFCLAETDTAPYVCRKLTPDSAHIWGVVSQLGLGVYPAVDGPETAALLAPFFPTDGLAGSPSAVRLYTDVLECGLSAMNPVVHPPGVLMNAGRVERSRGEFYFYDEGVTPAVCSVIDALDAERREIGAALGYDLPSVAEAFHAAGFGPKGDLWATINGSRMLTALRAPGAIRTRWLTEDVPFGLAAWASLAAELDVETPVMDSLVHLGRVAAGIPFDAGRGAEDLGLAGLEPAEMRRVASGAV